MKNLGTKGDALIKKFEGLELAVYGDAVGYPTVGYGHLLSNKVYVNYKNKPLPQADANAELKKGGFSYTSPITQSQANTIFSKDVKRFVDIVNEKEYIVSNFTQSQFDALVSLVFNIPDALTSKDMVALLNNPQTFVSYPGPVDTVRMNAAVTKAFGFTLAGGVQLPGLITRRNAEMELFTTGQKYKYNKIV